MKPKAKDRNFVAKYCLEFNKARTYTDRKKALKRGKVKHKASLMELEG